MTVQIVTNYISDSEADLLVSGLQNRLIPEQREGMSSALGQKNSFAASKVNELNPAVELLDDELENRAIIFASKIVNDIRATMEDFYGIELDLANMNFAKIERGGFNALHSDSTKIDGSPWRDDGIPEEIEYSALLYASDYEKDFLGGLVTFPQHNLEIKPEKGLLVFFKGDEHHLHEVHEVTSGARYAMVLFYARKGNISDGESFFTN